MSKCDPGELDAGLTYPDGTVDPTRPVFMLDQMRLPPLDYVPCAVLRGHDDTFTLYFRANHASLHLGQALTFNPLRGDLSDNAWPHEVVWDRVTHCAPRFLQMALDQRGQNNAQS